MRLILPTTNTGGTTTYSWTNNTTSINLAASGTGNIAAFNATNSTTAPVTATISLTPHYVNTSGGPSCDGPPQQFTITVNPTPTVSSASTKTICDEASVNYTITSATAETAFAWSRATVTGISEAGVSDQTSNPIIETLNNTTNAAIEVTYVITPTGPATTNCPGTPFNLVVTVNPTPDVIATPAAQTVCNNFATDIDLTTNITSPAVTYSWTTALTTGTASGFSPGNGINIAQTLTNSTNLPATVTYTITPAIGACDGTPIDVIVTVNPTGQVNQPGNQVVCNNEETTAVTFSTTNTGGTTTYSWLNNNTNINLDASGNGDIPVFTATNTGTTQITGTIVVTPHYINAGVTCDGPTKTFTISVNPTGQVDDPA